MIKDKKSNDFYSLKNLYYLNILPLTINTLQSKSWDLTEYIQTVDSMCSCAGTINSVKKSTSHLFP